MSYLLTVKCLALLLATSSILYHVLCNDQNYCNNVLIDGRYEGEQWQPMGCTLHNYTQRDAIQCFTAKTFPRREDKMFHIVIMGDSRSRQIYLTWEGFMRDGTETGEDQSATANWMHLEYKSNELNLHVQFIACYMLGNDCTNQTFENWIGTESGPDIIIFGMGPHYMGRINPPGFGKDVYEKDMGALQQVFQRLIERHGTKIVWKMQPKYQDHNENIIRKGFTTEELLKYNVIARRVLRNSSVEMWSSLIDIADDVKRSLRIEDGVHYMQITLYWIRTIMLNQMCNRHTHFKDATCCRERRHQLSSGQIVIVAVILLCIIATVTNVVFHFCCKKFGHAPNIDIGTKNNWKKFAWVFSKLGLIMCYMYVCDRTDLLMKERMHFESHVFPTLILLMIIVGLVFNKEAKRDTVLNREQTEEWKGWMQLVILTYHMMGLSKDLNVYMFVRVLVSSYIFLNGFVHFCYSWNGGEMSLNRTLQVLFRMNFLVMVLCITMNNSYQSYYFVPLISFWYVVQSVVMAIPPRITAKSTLSSKNNYIYLAIKLIVAIKLISISHENKNMLDWVFTGNPMKPIFASEDGSIQEWLFRWSLDRFSMVYGIVLAIFLNLGHRLMPLSSVDLLDGNSMHRTKMLQLLLASAVTFGITAYFISMQSCHTKEECNEIHSYIVALPILSFIWMRNAFGFLRRRFCVLLAWFGKISLELFIAQYHIWLAADAKAILVIVPNQPLLNLLLTTFIFVCAAHEINEITGMLTSLFVPKERNEIARNVVILFVIVLATGIGSSELV